MTADRCELLSLAMFESHKCEIDIVDTFVRELGRPIGWHYCLDLAWILRSLSQLRPGSAVLDGGGGCGLAQFILCELGYDVINVDFSDVAFGSTIMSFFGDRISYAACQNSETMENSYTRFLKDTYGVPASRHPGVHPQSLRCMAKRLLRRLAGSRRSLLPACAAARTPRERGRILVYKCDMKRMQLLKDESVDAVVSISAVEHNGLADARLCVAEMMRVMKTGGTAAITVSASTSADWFHEPSRGWCYSEETLRELFGLSPRAESNFGQKHEIMEEMKREGNELHRRLASFYFKSGANGMPWGKWDPQYLPVGILKTKESSR